MWLIITASQYVPCTADQLYWCSSWGEIFPPSQPAAYVFFQDPLDPAQHEPLSGYKFMGGGTFTGGGCLGFVFATDSDASREANLATLASIVEHARYQRLAG